MSPAVVSMRLDYVWDHKRKLWIIRCELGGVFAGSVIAESCAQLDAATATVLLREARNELEAILPF